MAWSSPPRNRSYACNRDLLVYQRERRGWTQAKLAEVAGYSERLISKAEAGRVIRVDTIDALATALSSPEDSIFPEDLINDPVQLAKEFIAAFYGHQANFMQVIPHLLDDDIFYSISGDPNVFPFAGEYRGIEEMARSVKAFFGMLEVPPNYDPLDHYTFLAQGNEVMIWGETRIQPIGFPQEKPVAITQHMKFRRGKIYYYGDRFDTLEGVKAMRAAGLLNPEDPDTNLP